MTAEPEVGSVKVDVTDPNVLFFLGSDGLFDVLEAARGSAAGAAGASCGVEAAMAAAVAKSGLSNLHGIAAGMVVKAIDMGSRDNVSCIVVHPCNC